MDGESRDPKAASLDVSLGAFFWGRRRRRAYPTNLTTQGDAGTRSQVSAEQSTAQTFNVEDTSPQLPESVSSVLSGLTPTEASLVGP